MMVRELFHRQVSPHCPCGRFVFIVASIFTTMPDLSFSKAFLCLPFSFAYHLFFHGLARDRKNKGSKAEQARFMKKVHRQKIR
jgi:hypothetical protein